MVSLSPDPLLFLHHFLGLYLLFRHYAHQAVQVEPTAGGTLEDVLSYVNITDPDMRILFVTDLVAGLIPGIPRPISVFHGPHGSAKSTALRLKKRLMDPAAPELQAPPKDAMEFVRIASHNFCVYLDNLSSIQDWLSDSLARFCTGDGFVKRALYTDDDDYIYTPQGVGGITGINLVVTAADLLDRSLVFQLDRIQDDHNVTEADLWNRFDEARSGLLGAMFDTLAKAIRIRETLERPARLPRLADYAMWGCSVALAMGHSAEAYWNAYATNTSRQTTEALDASPVAQAVLVFMEDKQEWKGTPSELLTELNKIAEEIAVDTSARAWPKDASWVTRRLNLVLPNLAQVGISYKLSRANKTRVVHFTSSGYAVTPVTPVTGQIETGEMGDDSDTNDGISPSSDVGAEPF